jgi:DNA-binding NarL/FixJ family response regulator
MTSADQLIPQIVDEIVFQPRRNLAQRALADVIPFTHDDQRAILAGSRALSRGRVPTDLPPRFLVSAASYALASGQISSQELSQQVIHHLASLNVQPIATLADAQQAVAA